MTLEQELQVQIVKNQAMKMSREECIQWMVAIYRQTILMQNSYGLLVKERWGIES
jgi:hypothetical protein